jgi:hypothetical protein
MKRTYLDDEAAAATRSGGVYRGAPTTGGLSGEQWQGLALVHFSAPREHFVSHVLGCFAGFSVKKGSGLAKIWTSVSP